jgi:hypothetical protein
VDRLQQQREPRAFLELLAQAPDVHVDRPLVALEIVTPDLFEQDRPRERDAGIRRELEQQRELARFQPDVAAVDPRFARRLVDLEPIERQQRGPAVATSPARRPSAFTRATSSRGENGLVT